MNYRFRPQARRELLEAARWYLVDGGPPVASRFEDAVKQALALLVAMPDLGSPVYASVRAWPVKRFPYTLVYRMNGDMLIVVAVAHQSRAPGYWVGRG